MSRALALVCSSAFLVACTAGIDIADTTTSGDGGEPGAGGGGAGGGGGSAGSAPSGPRSCMDLLAEAGACMSLDELVETGAYLVHEAQTDGGLSCSSCHLDAAGGFLASADAADTFGAWTTFPGIQRLISCTVDEDGHAQTLIPNHRIHDKGIEYCLPETVCHPSYELLPALADAIDQLVSLTIDRWTADTCGG